MNYQPVPPDDHQRNISEKAIQTWKYNFTGVLSGTAATLPMHLWCQLIPQTDKKLVLLGKSRAKPKISAYTHLYGTHNYIALPFLPIGMEALI